MPMGPAGRILAGGARGITAGGRIIYRYTAKRWFNGDAELDDQLAEMLEQAGEGLSQVHGRGERQLLDLLESRRKARESRVLDAEFRVVRDSERNENG